MVRSLRKRTGPKAFRRNVSPKYKDYVNPVNEEVYSNRKQACMQLKTAARPLWALSPSVALLLGDFWHSSLQHNVEHFDRLVSNSCKYPP